MGLAIIALGYAVIHSHLNDKTAVKFTALMGNISVLAPVFGPAIDSGILYYFSWHYIFIITALVSAISLVGLLVYTPNGEQPTTRLSIKKILIDYRRIISNTHFLQGVTAVVLAYLPLLLWIGQAPNLIISKLQQSFAHYVFYQILSVGGLAVSSIMLQFIAGRYNLYSIIRFGAFFIFIGLTIAALSFQSIYGVVAGLMLYNFGLGMANGCIIRIIISDKNFSPAMLATMMGFFNTFVLSLGITLGNIIFSHFDFSLLSFTLGNFVIGLATFLIMLRYSKLNYNRQWL